MLLFHTALVDSYLRFGTRGYVLPESYQNIADKIYNMPVRSDDVWVVTFPKSGTTWVQELVWMVANDCDFAKSAEIKLIQRFPFLEFTVLYDNDKGRDLLDQMSKSEDEDLILISKNMSRCSVEKVKNISSRRFIKTHVPLSLLPPQLLDTCKVVYVARDPRDVAISYFHHCKLTNTTRFTGDLKEFWNYFINNLVFAAPVIEHVKEAWELRHHKNMLFLFYEDLLKDLPKGIKQVADFLGKNLTEEQVSRLSDHLTFENFKKNKSVNYEFMKDLNIFSKDESFVRKGKSGGWREQFDDEMKQQAERWIQEGLRGSSLRYPDTQS
ncbi:hypothetical protein ACJJTC_006604 [Scirpophaga incertulas]